MLAIAYAQSLLGFTGGATALELRLGPIKDTCRRQEKFWFVFRSARVARICHV